jgi:ribulose-5-phosphate 4-epimerase/fuculose-1-phosphate aldolase
MIMGNHGVLFIGETVAETFTRMYYFERAARTYILALQTQQPLARTVRRDRGKDRAAEEGDAQAEARLLNGMRAVLDAEEPDYAA